MSHPTAESRSTSSTQSPRVWLITGASSGLGLAIARVALERGDIVVATLRKPEALKAQYPPERLLVVKVDVNNRDDTVTNAFKKTEETFSADLMLS
ncbi:hypothetical protein C8Q74DRAFT_1373402 [Fomes fomentarius]|nr:hypothetical protein C8Q74DRAFT_1373402 [Fomes fomentarius]